MFSVSVTRSISLLILVLCFKSIQVNVTNTHDLLNVYIYHWFANICLTRMPHTSGNYSLHICIFTNVCIMSTKACIVGCWYHCFLHWQSHTSNNWRFSRITYMMNANDKYSIEAIFFYQVSIRNYSTRCNSGYIVRYLISVDISLNLFIGV